MTAKEITDHLHAHPFQPFTVYTADGGIFPIPHPDFAAAKKNGRFLIALRVNDDGYDVVDVARVTRIGIDAVTTNV